MAETDPNPNPQPPTPPAPSPPTEHRRTEADLRAELAAERVSKADIQRTLEARATKAETDLAAAKAEADGRVTTEVTKVTERLTKMQARVVDAKLEAGAAAAGLRDPDLLLHPLLDRSKITISEDGEVTGVGEAFEALKTKKPEWFGQAQASGMPPPTPRQTGGPAPPPGTSNPPPVDVKAMNATEYAAHKASFRKNLRSVA